MESYNSYYLEGGLFEYHVPVNKDEVVEADEDDDSCKMGVNQFAATDISL